MVFWSRLVHADLAMHATLASLGDRSWETAVWFSLSSAVSPVAVVLRSLGRQTQSDHYGTQTPKLSSPDGYRLGITPSQYCIKPTQ